ncbi:AAA family ATPase [Butyrivibrio sp.]|uniref:AAA family ATPase n=1 Tax=Butyrivibrio sp. TaxID=28121 RepID=UPI0025B83912|nr:AAA family ATPase [Butyrivibrio sp.]MBQ9305801.1 AAA family ATPase [Butyrivibrio sp.]
MGRTVAIGLQDFSDVIEKNIFYVDKTDFIKRWWDQNDAVTLITRPRRFGKTLTMSMVERFFSVKYAGMPNVFQNLKIWNDERYHKIQGTYPVIFLSFAKVKDTTYTEASKNICKIISDTYKEHEYILCNGTLSEDDKTMFRKHSNELAENEAKDAISDLARLMYKCYGKKAIILLDEYDTPMQEAYVNGYWQEIVNFLRSLFNSTFKTNPYIERGILTGITRVSKESIFSDLNNLAVVTTISDKYADCFGFTESEVKSALNEQGVGDFEAVKKWYDGFIFGSIKDIYNPWSVISYLQSGNLEAYWANSSSNTLVSKLVREGEPELKEKMELLCAGKSIWSEIDEQIVYNQLDLGEVAIFSLLVASGYLKIISRDDSNVADLAVEPLYELALTNLEVLSMFRKLFSDWFANTPIKEGRFVTALFNQDIKMLNIYMNDIAVSTFSSFDVGVAPSQRAPERFYHGFVLGLMAETVRNYVLTSNRESGYGRYDVMMEPRNKSDKAVIIEFKVFDEETEKSLEDTLTAALKQIEDKKYDQTLIDRGIHADNILKYGFVFQGKKVLIGAK